MACSAGPRIPGVTSIAAYFDALNQVSYGSGNDWNSLYGGYTANVAMLTYSSGYFTPSYYSIAPNFTTSPASTLSVALLLSSNTTSTGTVFNLASGNQYVYSATQSANYDSVDYGANAIVSANTTINYSASVSTANYDSVDYGANATVTSNTTISYTATQSANYESVDYGANAIVTANTTISYSAIPSATYESVDYGTTVNTVSNFIDNTEQSISIGFDNSTLTLRFKNFNSEINLLENYTPTYTDLITISCNIIDNEYVVSLYHNSNLIKTATVPNYGNQLPAGNITIFGNQLGANYSNTPLRLFNVYNTALSDSDVIELNAALNTN